MSTEAELRRRWKADYDRRIDDALDVYDTLSDDHRKRVDSGDADVLAALAYMRDPAYTNPKDPNHQQVSKFVSWHFGKNFATDELIP